VTDLQADEEWMRLALTEAELAARAGEVPVGAIIVCDGIEIARARNTREMDRSAIAHAEIAAIQQACMSKQAWRLLNCTLYVTLEPCLMCAGAIYQARLDRVVFGTFDPKAGAMGSLYSVHADSRLNHQPAVTAGVLAEPCSTILKDFFAARRRREP
jgi:tRNA(adenine34) deaminase